MLSDTVSTTLHSLFPNYHDEFSCRPYHTITQPDVCGDDLSYTKPDYLIELPPHNLNSQVWLSKANNP